MEREIIRFAIPELAFHIQRLPVNREKKYRGIHQHRAVELIRVEQGTLRCHLGEECITLTPDSILLVNSQTIHQLEPITEGALMYIQVDLAKYESATYQESCIGEFITRMQAKPYGLYHGKNELTYIFDCLQREVAEKKTGYDSYIKAYILWLAAFMHREGLRSHLSSGTAEALGEIMPVISYIEKNYPYKLTLDELGKLINCDKFHLCRIFKKVTGSSIVNYCNYVRLRQAEQLLRTTNQNISETAFACGFTSIQYFNKVFKKEKGCSPSQFRKWKESNYTGA